MIDLVLAQLKKYTVQMTQHRTPTIGVIAPYRSQVANLKKALNNQIESLNISTVDQFQGRDQVNDCFVSTRVFQATNLRFLRMS